MINLSEIHFALPCAFILSICLPLVMLSLWFEERRNERSVLKIHRFYTQRFSVALLLFTACATVAGVVMCNWVLVTTRDNPFESPIFLSGLGLQVLVVLFAACVPWFKRYHQPIFHFSSLKVLNAVQEGKPSELRWLSPFLRLSTIVLLIIALARPQIASTETDIYTEGMDIVLTLDVSTSMRAVDFAPPSKHARPLSRIKGAKEVISRFIQKRNQDRLALVVFAAEAFTQVPLTLDYSILQNILSTVKCGLIKDGTAIGNSIIVSINRLRDSKAKSKVIILLTDGDENMSRISPQQAAEIAEGENIRVFPILVGKGGIAPYPVGVDALGRTRYSRVETRTNPELLKKIASITNAKFYRSVDQHALEKDFQDILNQMEKTRLLDPGRFTHHTEVFQLVVVGALLALLLELILRWSVYRHFP